MHGRMDWGDYPHTRFSGAGMEMDVPLIPAPVALITMILGIAIGVMIGHKKVLMHSGAGMTGGMGHGMMGGGMGAGMMGDMGAGRGFDGDWMKRKKTMMRAMGAHHHHADGSGPCWCGAGGESADVPEGAEKAEEGHA